MIRSIAGCLLYTTAAGGAIGAATAASMEARERMLAVHIAAAGLLVVFVTRVAK